MRKYIYLATICCAALATAISFSASAQEAAPAKTTILQEFEKNGGIVDYMGSSYGLDGWFLIDSKKNPQYAYTNKEGATLLGVLFDPEGKSETINQLKQLKIKRSGSQEAVKDMGAKSDNPAEIVYNQFSNAGWIHIGDKNAPYFYAVVSVDSPECKAMLDKMQKFIDSGKISIRLVPIAMTEESFYKTARIISSDNVEENIVNYMHKEAVELPSKDEIKTDTFKILDKNAQLAKDISLKGIPLIVYRRPIDGKISVISGVPDNPLLLASEIQNPVKDTKTVPAKVKTEEKEAK